MLIILALVWYLWKQTNLERFVLVPLEQSLFYQIHTLKTDLCLLLLSLKMSLLNLKTSITTISNWGFISKYKRHGRKSQINATINEIILKTLPWRELPSGLRHWRWIGKFLVQTQLSARLGLRVQPCYEVPDNLLVETWIHMVINIGWVTISTQ